MDLPLVAEATSFFIGGKSQSLHYKQFNLLTDIFEQKKGKNLFFLVFCLHIFNSNYVTFIDSGIKFPFPKKNSRVEKVIFICCRNIDKYPVLWLLQPLELIVCFQLAVCIYYTIWFICFTVCMAIILKFFLTLSKCVIRLKKLFRIPCFFVRNKLYLFNRGCYFTQH